MALSNMHTTAAVTIEVWLSAQAVTTLMDDRASEWVSGRKRSAQLEIAYVTMRNVKNFFIMKL